MRRATTMDRKVFLDILKMQGPKAAMQRIQQFKSIIDPRDIAEAERAVRQSTQRPQGFANGGPVGGQQPSARWQRIMSACGKR